MKNLFLALLLPLLLVGMVAYLIWFAVEAGWLFAEHCIDHLFNK